MGLTVENLSCDRSGRSILSGLSTTCPRGTALILRGPNGVGKSTFLRVLAGLVPAEAGKVAFDGAELGSDAYQESLFYSGHLDALKPALSVRENLMFWAALFGQPAAKIDHALATFDLLHLSDRPAGACSAGQKRRLGLARLALSERPLWLLDEPTVSLDDSNTGAFETLVLNHLQKGGAAVIATHTPLNLAPAETLELAPTATAANPTQDPFLAEPFG